MGRMRFLLFFALALTAACGGAVRGTETPVDGGGGGSSGAGGTGGVDFAACGPSDRCVVAFTGCCGYFGPPQLSDFAAINSSQVGPYHAATCPVPIACPRCAGSPNLYIGARCLNGRCALFDTRETPAFSACARDTDCRLRKGLECCECGAAGEWTA